MTTDTGRAGKEAPARPTLSQAVRAIQRMLRSDCNGGEADPGGLCTKASHREGRKVVAAVREFIAYRTSAPE